MDNNKKNPDILENLFKQMPEEELPASFRMNVMQQIVQETVKVKKRNEWFGLVSIIAASLLMLAIAIAAFFYIGLPQITSLKITCPEISLSALSFYFYIGILTLLLLFLDYRFRKVLRKDE